MNSDNLLNEGLDYFKSGELRKAEITLRRFLKVCPNHFDAMHFLGIILFECGRPKESIELIQRAIRSDSHSPQPYYNLGKIFKSLNMAEEAIENFKKAISIKPNYFQALNMLGNVYAAFGELDKASINYHKAIKIKPDFLNAYINLGNTLVISGRLNEGLNYYKTALSLKPDCADVHNKIGVAFMESGEPFEAIKHFNEAIRLDDHLPNTYSNLSIVLQDIGDINGAYNELDKAINCVTDNLAWRFRRILLLPVIPSSTSEIQRARKNLASNLKSLDKSNLIIHDPEYSVGTVGFYLSYHGMPNKKLLTQITTFLINHCPILTFTAKHCKQFIKKKQPTILKIGFVSSFLTSHTIGKLNQGIIKQLSKSRFRITIFCLPSSLKDIEEVYNKFADIICLSGELEKNHNIIAREKLDILFYPDIGMSPKTYYLAFARLAPVQLVTWGHPETTCIPNIDYFISSKLLEEKNANDFYSEKLIQLETLPTFYIRPKADSLKLERKDFNIPNDVNIYLCPQVLFKIHPSFDEILNDLLELDQNGNLILIDDHKGGFWREKILKRFDHSIPNCQQRIIFVPQLTNNEYLSLLELADVILDIPSFSGGNSSFEALTMGAPIVTWPQKEMRTRVTYALYKQMGVCDLVATNKYDYLELSYKLANNSMFKNTIQKKIKQNNYKLFEQREAIRNLEQFFFAAYSSL